MCPDLSRDLPIPGALSLGNHGDYGEGNSSNVRGLRDVPKTPDMGHSSPVTEALGTPDQDVHTVAGNEAHHQQTERAHLQAGQT